MKKGQQFVSKDRLPPSIGIEVTVPRIVLPSPLKESTEAGKTESGEVGEVQEQVRLLPLDNPLATQPRTNVEDAIVADSPATYISRRGLFHLFHLKVENIQQKSYLLQILRPRSPGKRSEQRKQEELCITDELSFVLDYQQGSSEKSTGASAVIHAPGPHYITIHLNEDGSPASYSIDGVEG
jgi:hypothetical protein